MYKTVPKHCPQCGTFFTVRTKNPDKSRIKYCSVACSKKANSYKSRGTYTKICECCGKEFKTIFSVQKYCSLDCYRNIWEKIYKENKGVVEKQCEFYLCREEFFTTNKNKKYCSTECYRKAKNNRDKEYIKTKKLEERLNGISD